MPFPSSPSSISAATQPCPALSGEHIPPQTASNFYSWPLLLLWGLKQQIPARAKVEASASPAHTALTAVPTGGKAALHGFRRVRWVGAKVDTEQSSCSDSFLHCASPLVSAFKWKIFHLSPQREREILQGCRTLLLKAVVK